MGPSQSGGGCGGLEFETANFNHFKVPLYGSFNMFSPLYLIGGLEHGFYFPQ